MISKLLDIFPAAWFLKVFEKKAATPAIFVILIHISTFLVWWNFTQNDGNLPQSVFSTIFAHFQDCFL